MTRVAAQLRPRPIVRAQPSLGVEARATSRGCARRELALTAERAAEAAERRILELEVRRILHRIMGRVP